MAAHTAQDDLDDLDETDAFGETISTGLPDEGRIALATLLTQRFITRSKYPAAWDGLRAYEHEIRERLNDMFMTLTLDTDHEVAFKRQVTDEGVPVLLRRDKPLNRDTSFLLILLRTEHAYADALDEAVVATRDQIAEFLNRFSADNGTDQVRLERRVDAASRTMEALGLLEATAEDPDTFVISPAVVPLVSTEVMAHLTSVYTAATGADGTDLSPEISDE